MTNIIVTAIRDFTLTLGAGSGLHLVAGGGCVLDVSDEQLRFVQAHVDIGDCTVEGMSKTNHPVAKSIEVA